MWRGRGRVVTMEALNVDEMQGDEQPCPFVFRSSIISAHNITSSQIQAYSKKNVGWVAFRYRTGSRTGVVPKRLWEHRTTKICKRGKFSALTENSCPFKVPVKSQNNPVVKQKVRELNEEYTFVQSLIVSDEEQYKHLEADVDFLINSMCKMNSPVTITAIAHLMLGTKGVATDVDNLSSMLRAPETDQLEWRSVPNVGRSVPISVPGLTGFSTDKLSKKGCEMVEFFRQKVIQHVSFKEPIASETGPGPEVEASLGLALGNGVNGRDISNSSDGSQGWMGGFCEAPHRTTGRFTSTESDSAVATREKIVPRAADVIVKVEDVHEDPGLWCPLSGVMRQKMCDNLQIVVRPKVYTLIKWLGYLDISWFTVGSLFLYLCLSIALTYGCSLVLKDFSFFDGLYVWGISYGPIVVTYVYTWIELPSAVTSMYLCFLQLDEHLRQQYSQQWFRRWCYASAMGISLNLLQIGGGAYAVYTNTDNNIISGRECWFIGLSVASFFLSIPSTLIVCFGYTLFEWVLRCLAQDIKTVAFNVDSLRIFFERCRKIQKYRSQTYLALWSAVVGVSSLIFHTSRSLKKSGVGCLKFFAPLPFATILPYDFMQESKKVSDANSALIFTIIGLLFIRGLNNSLWAAKAYYSRKNIPTNCKSLWKNNKDIVGWQNCYRLDCMPFTKSDKKDKDRDYSTALGVFHMVFQILFAYGVICALTIPFI